MENQFSRTEQLLGTAALTSLKNARVAVFGIGGVGSYAAEALARCGVGAIDLIDRDVVSLSNINRQLVALHSTVGASKVEAMKSRLIDINPNINVATHNLFFNAETLDKFNFKSYSYIADAIDTVTSKLLLIETAYKSNVPIISCMGAGNKLDPTKFEVDDIYHTSVCPLAKVVRSELRRRNIEKLKVVYSKEPPAVQSNGQESQTKKAIPASVSFVPSVAGLILAGEIVKDIIKILR